MRIKKLFKSSVILTAVVLIALISIAAVCSSSRSDEKLYASEEYMLSENLALNAITTDNDGSAIKSVTDGKSSTARIADRREGYYLTVDFGKTTEFNSVILKEDGLNVKSFVLYKSSDGVNFEKIFASDKIEYHRFCSVDRTSARYLKLEILKSDETLQSKK